MVLEAGADLRLRLQGMVPALLALARARLRSAADADDAVQETLLRALSNLSSYRPEAPFRNWVFTIAVNVIRNFGRDRRFAEEHRPLPAEEVRLDPAEAFDAMEDLDRLRRTIAKLDAGEAGPLLLHHIHGVPQREVAAYLEIPVEHLRVRLFRTIQKIRRALKE